MATGNSGVAWRVGEWTVNPGLDTVSRAGETQKLEPRTMRLLICLVEADGDVVSQDRLLTEVWAGVVVGPASVYQAISQLRKVFNDVEQQPRYIATVPRKGYRLVAEVSRPERAKPVTPAAGDDGQAGAPIALVAPVASVSLEAPNAPLAQAATVESRMPVAPAPTATTIATTTAAVGAVHYGLDRRRARPNAPLRSALILAAVLLVSAAVAWAWLRRTSLGESAGSAIVVLPFVDMTAEKTGQPFCDGLSEELSNWLSQIPSLRVVARTSAFAFGSQGTDVRAIGRALGTTHVLEGSMRRYGDHMRVTVQLIDAHNGYHLWSANYDQPMQDTIRMQDDISRSVAQNLQIRLTSATAARFGARGSRSPEAYQLYLQARFEYHQRNRDANRRSIDLYRQALTVDPQFALAYVGLSYSLLNTQAFDRRPIGEVAEEAEPLIVEAVRLDPHLPDVYAVRAALRSDQNRIAEAKHDLKLAISLNPNDSAALAELGRLSLYNGEPRAALLNLNRSVALDPLDFRLKTQLCTAYEDMGQFEEARSACERAHELQPDNAVAVDKLTWLAWSRGYIGDALRWNRESLKLAPDTFDFYWTRAELYWTLLLPKRARTTLEFGRAASKDEETAGVALGNVVYLEGGPEVLKAYLNAAQLDASRHSVILEEVARLRLLLGEPAAAASLIKHALEAADREPELTDTPWSARTGESCQLVLAAAELQMGVEAAARGRLNGLVQMLDTMEAAGVERSAVFALRAEAHAMLGHDPEALRDLERAVHLGWRRSWWALKEPYFTSLRSKPEFRRLMDTVEASNRQLLQDLGLTDATESLDARNVSQPSYRR